VALGAGEIPTLRQEHRERAMRLRQAGIEAQRGSRARRPRLASSLRRERHSQVRVGDRIVRRVLDPAPVRGDRLIELSLDASAMPRLT
jgi:hypothetical protein